MGISSFYRWTALRLKATEMGKELYGFFLPNSDSIPDSFLLSPLSRAFRSSNVAFCPELMVVFCWWHHHTPSGALLSISWT